MHPLLRLTEDERRYNDLYDDPTTGRRGVIERRYGYTVQLTASNPTPSFAHRSSRRARIFQLTFSGYLQGAKMRIRSAMGESYTQDPLHLPLFCGASCRDPNSVHPTLVPANFPQIANSQFMQNKGPRFAFVIDPNIVLPGSAELYFDFAPQLQNDPVLAGDGYPVGVIVHAWEFPGYQGGAL